MAARARKLHGNQTPTFSLIPKHAYSDGPDACDLAEAYGMPADPWQRTLLDAWFACDEHGMYLADDAAVSVPRQNGKNGAVEFAELYLSAILGRRILHTAHEVKTCRKHFMRMKAYFENERDYPELVALVSHIRQTNGQEAIILKNGGSIEFIARSKSSGRGFTVDVLVCDEAQELNDEQMEAIQPATSSAPSGNPLNIYLGTPTPPGSNGTVFARLRQQAHAHTKRLCWLEWSVDEVGDIHDRSRWERTNPSLGIRLLPNVIESEVKKFTPDGFARERLGWWDDTAQRATDMNVTAWKECRTDTPTRQGHPAYAIKFTPDGSHVTLAVCQRPDKDSDEKPHVEIIAYKPMTAGLEWLAEFLTTPAPESERPRWKESLAIVVDGRTGAPTLLSMLTDQGVSRRVLRAPKAMQMCDAASMLENAINAHKLTHYGQDLLDQCVTNARHRKIGADGFGYEPSTANLDVTPLETIAYAYWAAQTSKRHPDKKARAVVL